ncbi:MAG TPA: TusE/DsrC/DsvC family sulfur relay protein, partial [Marmoricola sp.]|nr:TusE/DsrC/DsvC family sulfur relay protein [Marmoricola sp.]
MPTTTLAGHAVDVTEDGFLKDPSQWSEELADVLAKQIGIALSDAHWVAIRFARKDYEAT